MISFNFGWSGSDDGFYEVDAIDYSSQAAAIINYVPSIVYTSTIQAPSNLTVNKTNEYAQEATLSWTNPTKTMNNVAITAIEQIVVTRNGKVIYTADNPTPGSPMSFVDTDVPCYSTFEYKVYAMKDGVKGAPAIASESFGPTCEWKVIGSTTNMTGWKNGYVIAYDGAGREIDRFTMTSNNPTTYNMDLTIGRVSFVWKAGTDDVDITLKIKNSTGSVVYEFSGNTSEIAGKTLFVDNNGCGNAAPTSTLTNLVATYDGENIILTWDGSAKDNFGVNIYRDGLLCELSHSNEYVDEAPSVGGHCYQVCVLGEGGESERSNEACATAGEGCDPGRDIWYYLQTNGKPAITWEHPENTTGLTGYYVYCKKGADGTYDLVKLLGATKKEYKETKTLEQGYWYYYRVIAYYQGIECYSAPIKNKFSNEFYVKIFMSPEGVVENMTQVVEVYPNPVKDNLTVKAEGLSNVVVYNSLGQKVFEQALDADEVTINTSDFEAGLYMVRIVANGEEVTRKVSVVK